MQKLGITGDIYSKLASIDSNTATIPILRTDLQTGSGSIKVSEIVKPSTLIVGSKAVTSDDGAVQMRVSTGLKSGVNIKAPITNTGLLYVGAFGLARSTSSGYPLDPGESVFLELSNMNLIYIRTDSSTSQVAYYLGS